MKLACVALALLLATLTLFNLSCSNRDNSSLTTAASSTENPSSKPEESSSIVSGQQSACSLLTSSDIEVATGAKPGDPHPSDLSAKGGPPGSGTCFWVVAAQKGQVVLSIGPLPPGVTIEAAARQNAGMEALRAARWTEETKSFSKTLCSVMTPPTSEKDGVNMSSCTGEVKGVAVSLVFMSPTKRLSLDETKALFDKAVERVR